MGNKSFLKISIICFIFTTLTVNAQNVKGENNMFKTELGKDTWITSEIIGLKPKVKEYVLTKFVEESRFAGYLLNFKENNIYTSRYAAPCGNDYLTAVNGKYKFVDKNKISFIVDSVTYSGMAEKPTEYRRPKKLLFEISKEDEKIILRKIIK